MKEPRFANKPREARKPAISRPIPVPPWQLWSPDSLGNPEVESAERALQRGDLEAALYSYREAATRSEVQQVRDEAMLRALGTLLKLGRSKEALASLSTYLKVKNEGPTDADTRFSMVAAYGYVHAQDWDQALAWLGMVHVKTNGQGVYARRAIAEAQRIVARLPASTFQSFAQRWSEDPFAGRVFSRERLRRAQGASADLSSGTNWFAPELYRPDVTDAAVPMLAQVREAPVAQSGRSAPALSEQLVIGVLLPLSGRFAEHAEKVKRGIEFAVSEMQAENVRLVFADTAADPVTAAAEYNRLVTEQGAAIVLGPLLVKTTEQVAHESQKLGVPIVTFTKREGVPALGETVFRLGATLESQVEELLAYAVDELAISKVSVLYPTDESGREFVTLFLREAARRSVTVVSEVAYQPGNDRSAEDAVRRLIETPTEAIFIPDSLENAYPLLAALDTSPLNSAVLLGPAQWNDPIAVRGYGQLIDGAVYVAPFFPKSLKPTVSEFVQRYLEAFKTEPELLAAQAYDATWFAVKALRSPVAGQQTSIEKLRAAQTVFGVTGKLDVGTGGEINRRMSVLRLHQGDVVEVMSSGTVTGFVPDGVVPAPEGQQNREQVKN